MKSLTGKIPSFLWLPMIVGAAALLIGGSLAIFYAAGYVEGFASVILLILGWWGFRIGNNSDDFVVGGLGTALGIAFFALMGMTLDQPGNFLYNQPMEWLFCPENSELARATIQRGSYNGVSLSQNFACIDRTGGAARAIAGYEHFGFRFVQYVLIGYVLLALSRIHSRLRKKDAKN